MQRRTVPRTDPRYNQLRARNNDSVKKSREKSRRERSETIDSINKLEEENTDLLRRIEVLKQEYQQLQDLFKSYTGISIDQHLESHPPSTSASNSSAQRNVNQTTENNSSHPILNINTTNDNTTVTQPNVELDPTNLDGAVVLINGVQYRIVSMTQN